MILQCLHRSNNWVKSLAKLLVLDVFCLAPHVQYHCTIHTSYSTTTVLRHSFSYMHHKPYCRLGGQPQSCLWLSFDRWSWIAMLYNNIIIISVWLIGNPEQWSQPCSGCGWWSVGSVEQLFCNILLLPLIPQQRKLNSSEWLYYVGSSVLALYTLLKACGWWLKMMHITNSNQDIDIHFRKGEGSEMYKSAIASVNR